MTLEEDMKAATQEMKDYLATKSNDFPEDVKVLATVLRDAGWKLEDSVFVHKAMERHIESTKVVVKGMKWELMAWRVAIALTLAAELLALYVR